MAARSEGFGMGDAYRRAYTAANYRLRTLAGGRWADHCRPTDIGFLMTNLCNAKCVHCDIWKNKGKDDTPTIDQYKATLNDMRAWLGPVHVFFSGGEALLRPYTPEVLAHAASDRTLCGDSDPRLLGRSDPHRKGGAGQSQPHHSLAGRRRRDPYD